MVETKLLRKRSLDHNISRHDTAVVTAHFFSLLLHTCLDTLLMHLREACTGMQGHTCTPESRESISPPFVLIKSWPIFFASSALVGTVVTSPPAIQLCICANGYMCAFMCDACTSSSLLHMHACMHLKPSRASRHPSS